MNSRWFLVLISWLTLLAGCRSERMAFRFQAPPTPVSYRPDSVQAVALPPVPAAAFPAVVLPKNNPPRHRHRAAAVAQPRSHALPPAASARPQRHLRPAQHQLAEPSTPGYGVVLLVVLLVLACGVTLAVGGLKLALYLGGFLGILVGAFAVGAGLIIALLSLAAAMGEPGTSKLRVNALTVLGGLLVALGLSPLLKLPWALLFPGSALLAFSLGVMLFIFSQ